jgi:hypothetical protein
LKFDHRPAPRRDIHSDMNNAIAHMNIDNTSPLRRSRDHATASALPSPKQHKKDA